MAATDPLIVTAQFDATSAQVFQSLRDRHFPAPRNIVPAHLTLFHHLPGEAIDEVEANLAVVCGRSAPVAFVTAGIRFLGRGVAFEVAAPALAGIRADLAQHWAKWLTPQDRQAFRPHVTVQNKADPADARRLRDELSAGLEPVAGTVIGLCLWHYRNGPWQRAGAFPLGSP